MPIDELTKKFYLKSFRKDRQASYYVIANIIMEVFAPESLVDFGCGLGWILYYLKKHFSLHDLVGIEPNPKIQHLMHDDVCGFIWPYTLETQLDLGRKFDLAVSFEAIEHIDKEHEEMVIDNITRHSDTVMFSGAQPGQGGYGHVNEQPKPHWIRKFETRGYTLDQEATGPIVSTMRQYGCKHWYVTNTMIFRKGK